MHPQKSAVKKNRRSRVRKTRCASLTLTATGWMKRGRCV